MKLKKKTVIIIYVIVVIICVLFVSGIIIFNELDTGYEKPSTLSTKDRTRIDNPNPFKNDLVIKENDDIYYDADQLNAAALYFYDTTGLQFYIAHVTIESNEEITSILEAESYLDRWVEENILSKDPYAVIQADTDMRLVGVDENGYDEHVRAADKFYYGSATESVMDGEARMILKEYWDTKYYIKSRDNPYMYALKGTADTIMNISSEAIVVKQDPIVPIVVTISIVIVLTIFLVVFFKIRSRKLDLQILKTDLKENEDLVNKYLNKKQ